jgi:CubicO group peptidase (beta-lactamase class C family)
MMRFKIQQQLILTLAGLMAAFLLASCETKPVAGISLSDPAALDRLIDSYVEADAFPFIYARLEDKQGRVIYEHSAVNRDVLPDASVDGQSWIRIWSMSKIVTISVVLDLVEDGILSLDDPVTQFIPEFADLKVAVSAHGADLSVIEDKDAVCPLQQVPMNSVMTVLDLINHQAGFYYATTGISCLDDLIASKNLPMAENSQVLVERMAGLPLIQQPGTNDFYGTNTTVLGIVAERATGKSLKQLVEERVTEPLQIEGLRYGLPQAASLLPRISGQDGRLRKAHRGELDIFGPDVPDYDPAHELYLGGEGMLATADGYADFLRMLLNRGSLNGQRFLNTETVEDIASPHTQLDSPYGYNGYNLWVNKSKLPDGEMVEGGLWIGGGYEGTHFWIDPKREFVAVIMTQMFWTPESGYGRDEAIRKAVYEQIR